MEKIHCLERFRDTPWRAKDKPIRIVNFSPFHNPVIGIFGIHPDEMISVFIKSIHNICVVIICRQRHIHTSYLVLDIYVIHFFITCYEGR